MLVILVKSLLFVLLKFLVFKVINSNALIESIFNVFFMFYFFKLNFILLRRVMFVFFFNSFILNFFCIVIINVYIKFFCFDFFSV